MLPSPMPCHATPYHDHEMLEFCLTCDQAFSFLWGARKCGCVRGRKQNFFFSSSPDRRLSRCCTFALSRKKKRMPDRRLRSVKFPPQFVVIILHPPHGKTRRHNLVHVLFMSVTIKSNVYKIPVEDSSCVDPANDEK